MIQPGYNRHASWAGLTAIIGGLMAIVLTPPFAIAYFTAYPGFDAVPPWVVANRFALGPLLAFDTPVAVYNLYGKVFDAVYPLFLPAVLALHHAHRHAKARLEKWGFGILVVGLMATFIGVAGDYWLDGAGFIIEMPGLLILAIGATLYGIAMLRGKSLPGCCAVLLVACGPASFVSFALIGHIPSGPTFPLAVCWVALGSVLLAGVGKPPEPTTLGAKQP